MSLSQSQMQARAQSLNPYLGPMQNAATSYGGRFQSLGMNLTPERILSVAMQESGGTRDPANAIGKGGDLGVMQLLPTNGKFDPEVANAIGWDNTKTVNQNRSGSQWNNPINNINAGVIALAGKAAYVAAKYPQKWAGMTEDQKWDAALYAYNRGQGNAFKQIEQDTDGSYDNISNYKYVADVDSQLDYLDSNSPFPSSPTPSRPGYD